MKTFKQFMTENREVNEGVASWLVSKAPLFAKGLGDAAKIVGGAGLGAWLTSKFMKANQNKPRIQNPVYRGNPDRLPGHKGTNSSTDV